MSAKEQPRGFRLSALLDYFIPEELQVHAESHRRARMFMLSHVFGPILGNTIPIYLAVAGISRDMHAVIFFLSILAFWAYPFALRRTGKYQLLCFLSVQNLIFCVLWACYAYGGLTSPFVPWILIFPLLAFLYLPPVGWVRNVLLAQIYGSVALFLVISFLGVSLPSVTLSDFQVIGMISLASVAIYFAMMSLYFARMFQEQREFTREINSLVSTSDNLINLTAAANQARTAKADFVAGMSHELRTPLNAITGYSSMLIEEAQDEGEDEDVLADLGHVHKAGSDLLQLIDDVLTYSRIEAGKMPINPRDDLLASQLEMWLADPSLTDLTAQFELVVTGGGGMDRAVFTDWNIAASVVRHLICGVARRHEAGRIEVSCARSGAGLVLGIVDLDQTGRVRPISIVHEVFDDVDDASPTKYGGHGIEVALASKLAQLIGGSLSAGRLPDGRPGALFTIPDMTPAQRLAA